MTYPPASSDPVTRHSTSRTSYHRTFSAGIVQRWDASQVRGKHKGDASNERSSKYRTCHCLVLSSQRWGPQADSGMSDGMTIAKTYQISITCCHPRSHPFFLLVTPFDIRVRIEQRISPKPVPKSKADPSKDADPRSRYRGESFLSSYRPRGLSGHA